ncbi:MAG: hypothetical protein ACK559_11500, partial [bacterium]
MAQHRDPGPLGVRRGQRGQRGGERVGRRGVRRRGRRGRGGVAAGLQRGDQPGAAVHPHLVAGAGLRDQQRQGAEGAALRPGGRPHPRLLLGGAARGRAPGGPQRDDPGGRQGGPSEPVGV